MFQAITLAPADPILGLSEAFARDTRPNKVNLAVGVFKDDEGRTPILQAVKTAEQRLTDEEKTKSYLPIDGSPDYAQAVQAMLFGADHPIIAAGRAASSHTPGGTGALRVAADYLRQNHGQPTVHVSDPTWANHPSIFKAAGLNVATYPYFDPATNGLSADAMLAALAKVAPGDVVLLHACCHNPTGVDPAPDDWQRIASVLADRQALPLVDFAYQGFGDGVEEDAAGLRLLADALPELLICSSFSKNFGLYNERVGALTVVASDDAQAAAVQSHVKIAVRTNYSNPPAHGGQIVRTILGDATLTGQWRGELDAMRQRIHTVRGLFCDKLNQRGVRLSPDGNDFVARQRGMFSFTGLTKDEVQKLRDEHAIYIVGSGRINVAGLAQRNIDAVCDAIAAVRSGRSA